MAKMAMIHEIAQIGSDETIKSLIEIYINLCVIKKIIRLSIENQVSTYKSNFSQRKPN